MFLSFIIFCAVMVKVVVCYLLLDLGCTHTRESDLCLSTIDPQSPVHFTSVTALYRVQCGSFNHALARLKRWLGCACSVTANRTGAWNS